MQTRDPAGLRRQALRGVFIFAVILWLLIFVPGGSLGYWQGWLFWLHFMAWTISLSLYFLEHDPALVERRLRSGPTAEREPVQKLIQLVASVLICATFIVSALDYRLSWSTVPAAGVIIGHVLVVVGYVVMFKVFRENSFAAATVQVVVSQVVVATGPYAVIRHPMYAGASLMFLGMPLALGSWWGVAPVVCLIAALVARLMHEEVYLVRNLAGYDAYQATVRYRLVPGVW